MEKTTEHTGESADESGEGAPEKRVEDLHAQAVEAIRSARSSSPAPVRDAGSLSLDAAGQALASLKPTGKAARALPALRRWAVDLAVAAAAFLFGWGQLMLTSSSIIIQDVALRQYLGTVSVTPTPQVIVALAVTVVPLVLRRKLPWTVFAVCLITFLAAQAYYPGISFMAAGPAVALYTIALQKSLPKAVVAGFVAAAGIFVFQDPDQALTLAFFTRFQNIALLVASVLAGYAVRTHHAYVRAVEERAEEAERTREEEAAKRVEAERVLIAREVHDITAHSLSAVSIQAAAAERLIDVNPAAAKEAIATVRATSRQALGDIRSMIGVLRHGDEPAERTPAQGTDQLREIADYLRKAGLDVTLAETRYHRSQVPAHVDMALFGIAREASTNIVKHGRAAHVRIELSSDDDSATLSIADDGQGSGTPLGSAQLPQAADGAGHGVQGMAERVHVLGGAFQAGDTENGFTIRATIPFAKE